MPFLPVVDEDSVDEEATLLQPASQRTPWAPPPAIDVLAGTPAAAPVLTDPLATQPLVSTPTASTTPSARPSKGPTMAARLSAAPPTPLERVLDFVHEHARPPVLAVAAVIVIGLGVLLVRACF